MQLPGYARLLFPVDGVPSGALIYILEREGNRTRFVHRKTMNVYEAELGIRSLLIFPPASRILMLLSDHTPVGVTWNSSDVDSYHVTGMQYGVPTTDEVPVYKKGKKVGKRTVNSCRHVRIKGRTFDQAVYLLFFATLSGKLRKHKGDAFEYLVWDQANQVFKTEIRKV